MCEEIKDNPAGFAGEAENQTGNGDDNHVPAPSANPGEGEDPFLWKEEIVRNCRRWVEDLEELPPVSETDEEPDLYSFFEQLCILRSEFRKNSRRSHETFSQFGEHLGEFQSVLDVLTQRLEVLAKEQESAEFLSRQGLLLQMVELFERLRWFGKKLEEIQATPQHAQEWFRPVFWKRIKRFFAGRQKAPGGISESLREGFSLTLSHFEEFLSNEGVSRIETTGMAFDPSVMIAMGTVETDDCPPNRVCEEISGGYRYGEHVLKLAKVTVAKRKEP